MIINIRVQRDNGKYTSALPSEFAIGAFETIQDFDGWWFFRLWLSRFCLQQAEKSSANAIEADRWIRRYQALRALE